jgi:hypothetical protein
MRKVSIEETWRSPAWLHRMGFKQGDLMNKKGWMKSGGPGLSR